MYAGDSFFTLTNGGQVGLLVLSLVLVIGVGLVAWRGMRARPLWTRIGVAVLCYGVFVWLSPQVYYTYYRFLIDGLPRQWVIGWPPVSDMAHQLAFSGRATLSAHGQGALFWGLILLAIRVSGVSGPRR